MASQKESTKVRRIKATEAEIVKKPAKKAKSARILSVKKPKFKKFHAPKWLRTIGKPFAKVLGPVFHPVGQYVKGSFEELRQTKWPNRKSAWILTVTVIVFSVLFAVVILAIDQLFDFIVKSVIL